MSRQRSFALVVVAFVSCTALGETLKEVTSVLARRESRLKSLTGVFTIEEIRTAAYFNYYEIEQKEPRVLTRYKWLQDLPKSFYMGQPLDLKSGEPVNRTNVTLAASDGSKDFIGAFEKRGSTSGAVAGTYDKRIGMPSSPLSLGDRAGSQWIREWIRSGSFRVTGTKKVEGFGRVLEVEGIAPSWERVTINFASDFGFLPVMKELRGRADGNILRFRTTKASVVDTVWFPMEGVMELARVREGVEELLIATTFRVQEVHLGPVSPDVFEIKLKPGSIVRDEILGQYYRIGSKGEKVILEKTKREKHAAAQRPWGWLLIVSASVLVTAVSGAIARRIARGKVAPS